MAQGFLVAVLGMVVNAGAPYVRGLPSDEEGTETMTWRRVDSTRCLIMVISTGLICVMGFSSVAAAAEGKSASHSARDFIAW